jgi:hypothetical protein
MFTIVIPTFWSDVSKFDLLIERLTSHNLISEVLVINNAPYKCSHRYTANSKVKELIFQDVYLFQSWNIGVYQSKNEFVCLMTDIIDFNIEVLDFIQKELKNENVHVIGTSKECLSIESDFNYKISKIEMRNKFWSTLIFTKKSKWNWIPEDFKIYFGDDYIIKQFSGFIWKIDGLKVRTINSLFDGMSINEIIDSDTNNSYKYNLPLSYDY